MTKPPKIVSTDTKWVNTAGLPTARWKCGYCGERVAEEKGYETTGSGTRLQIRPCPACQLPTVFELGGDWHFPASVPGGEVESVPDDLARLYDEARDSAGVGAFTAAVTVCRTMLMHIAVEKGAKERDTFESYVQFLFDKSYIPPEGKALADFVKSLGRDANHKIRLMDAEDAEAAIMCVEALLRLIYELPARLPAKVRAAQEARLAADS